MHKAELTASTHDRLYVLFFLGEVTPVSVSFRFHFKCSSRFDRLQFRLHNDYFFCDSTYRDGHFLLNARCFK